MEIANLFWSGQSLAERLPEAYWFPGTEVRIRRRGTGVILEPLPSSWDWLDELPGTFDNDAANAAREEVGLIQPLESFSGFCRDRN